MRVIVPFLVPFAFLLAPAVAPAQSEASDRSLEDAVRSAMSVAPRSVTADATIVGSTMPPSESTAAERVLHEGSNGWVCMPDNPDVPGDSPACVDEPWRAFLAGEGPWVMWPDTP